MNKRVISQQKACFYLGFHYLTKVCVRIGVAPISEELLCL